MVERRAALVLVELRDAARELRQFVHGVVRFGLGAQRGLVVVLLLGAGRLAEVVLDDALVLGLLLVLDDVLHHVVHLLVELLVVVLEAFLLLRRLVERLLAAPEVDELLGRLQRRLLREHALLGRLRLPPLRERVLLALARRAQLRATPLLLQLHLGGLLLGRGLALLLLDARLHQLRALLTDDLLVAPEVLARLRVEVLLLRIDVLEVVPVDLRDLALLPGSLVVLVPVVEHEVLPLHRRLVLVLLRVLADLELVLEPPVQVADLLVRSLRSRTNNRTVSKL